MRRSIYLSETVGKLAAPMTGGVEEEALLASGRSPPTPLATRISVAIQQLGIERISTSPVSLPCAELGLRGAPTR